MSDMGTKTPPSLRDASEPKNSQTPAAAETSKEREPLSILPNGCNILQPLEALILQSLSSRRESAPMELYVSQAQVMISKAIDIGVNRVEYDAFFRDKIKHAISRFPSESEEWKTWFAESLVWKEFFQGPFPGQEPTRLYPLRLSAAAEAPDVKNAPNIESGPAPVNGSRLLKAPSTYMSQEALMERKARAVGVRKEFFKFLQGTRDRARSEHPNCSAEYRRWFADSLTWDRFFRNEPFPGREPVASHSQSCIPSGLRSVDSANMVSPGQFQPPEYILTALKAQRQRLAHGLDGPIVMVNTLPVSSSIGRLLKELASYASDDLSSKNYVETNLKCHFRYKQVAHGDIAIWNEPFSVGDKQAFEEGDRFLRAWIQKCSAGRSRICDFWMEFSDSARIALDLDSCQYPFLILVNGKYMECSIERFHRLCESFSQNTSGRRFVEIKLKCDLMLIAWDKEERIRQLLARTSHSNVNASDIEKHESAINRQGGDKFLEAWAKRVLVELQGSQTLTIHDYWTEYRELEQEISHMSTPLMAHKIIIPSPSVRSRGRLPSSDTSCSDRCSDMALGDPESWWAKYATAFKATEIDRLFIEETAKAEGSLRMVFDEETQETITLDEFARRIGRRFTGNAANSLYWGPEPQLQVYGTDEDEETRCDGLTSQPSLKTQSDGTRESEGMDWNIDKTAKRKAEEQEEDGEQPPEKRVNL